MTLRPGGSWRWRQPPGSWTSRGRGDSEDSGRGPRLVRVNLDRSHFRSARWWLVAEAVLLMALGTAGLLKGPPQQDGAGNWQLALTPVHCWLLIGFGVLAALASVHRRTTLAAATFGAIAGILLFAIGTATLGTPASGHSTLRLWRYQVGDSVLFCVLTAYNFAMALWLVANAIEGPAWIRRDDGSADDDAD